MMMEDERIALIGKKADYYISRFNNLEQGKSGGWNWCGFLIGPLWFAYRKMYVEAACAFAVIYFAGVAVSMLVSATGNTDFGAIGSTVSLAWAAVQGGMANKVYWWRINKLMRNAMQAHVTARKCGTSKLAVVIALILIIAIDITGLYL